MHKALTVIFALVMLIVTIISAGGVKDALQHDSIHPPMWADAALWIVIGSASLTMLVRLVMSLWRKKAQSSLRDPVDKGIA